MVVLSRLLLMHFCVIFDASSIHLWALLADCRLWEDLPDPLSIFITSVLFFMSYNYAAILDHSSEPNALRKTFSLSSRSLVLKADIMFISYQIASGSKWWCSLMPNTSLNGYIAKILIGRTSGILQSSKRELGTANCYGPDSDHQHQRPMGKLQVTTHMIQIKFI